VELQFSPVELEHEFDVFRAFTEDTMGHEFHYLDLVLKRERKKIRVVEETDSYESMVKKEIAKTGY